MNNDTHHKYRVGFVIKQTLIYATAVSKVDISCLEHLSVVQVKRISNQELGSQDALARQLVVVAVPSQPAALNAA